MELRTSERTMLRDCPQKWYWSQVEGLEPNQTAPALWFGTAVHEGLAQWYQKGFKRGPHPAETFEKALEGDRKLVVVNEDAEREFIDARAMGVDMLTRYVEHYGQDERFEMIATEYPFRLLLPQRARTVFGHRLPAVKRAIRHVGTWDGLYRDTADGSLWILEHKTAASIRVDHLPLDDQAGAYPALAEPVLRAKGILGEKESISGINYNFLRKAVGDTRPMNADGLYTNQPTKQHYLDALEPFYELTGKETVEVLKGLAEDEQLTVLGEPSASQPPDYFERFPVYRSRAQKRRMIQRIQDDAFFAQAYRNGDLPVTKHPNRDRCSFCPFYKTICQMDEAGDQATVEEMKELMFHVRDPYADHRERKSA